MDKERKSIYKHNVKLYFEPVYYAKNVSAKSFDPIQFEETYHRVSLEKIEFGANKCKIHTSTLTGSYHYTVGKLRHELQVFKRLSPEHHPARIPMEPSPQAQIQKPPAQTSNSPIPLHRKPLPPAPKGKAPAGSREGSSSGILPPSNLGFSEQGDFYFEQKQFVKAFEAFSQALAAAEEANQPQLMSDCLKKLGKVDIEQGEWIRGAKLLNGALALCPAESPGRQEILNLMVELDKRFLKTVCGATDHQLAHHPGPEKYQKRRDELNALRKFSYSKDSESRTEGTVKTFTRSLKPFIQKMFEEGFTLMGNPPCAYALLSLGSFGREEMCFSSDLEFAALIAALSPASLDWFCKAFTYLELQVIHLGETKFSILKRGSPTKSGLSYDSGGNTPLGKTDRKKPLLEQTEALLIKTPQLMANLQSPTNYNRDMILTNALKGAGFIMGNPTLYEQYVQGMNSILNGLNPKEKLTIRQRRALDLIEGHLPEFKPEISQRKQENPCFEVKAELCRLPIFLIQGLCEYLGIDHPNTWDKLRALQEKGFSPLGIENLQTAIELALKLRLRLHYYYGSECDMAYHPSMQAMPAKRDPSIERPYYLSREEILNIITIYRVLFPLHRAFQNFLQNPNLEELKKQTFFQETLFTQWELHEQSQPDILTTPAITLPAPGAWTTARQTPAVRPRVIQSLAQACGTAPGLIEKEMADQCPCYPSQTIGHGFYQDCLLTQDFVEKFLLPFLKKHQVQQLDLISCQPEDDALIPLFKNWEELGIKKLILPRMLTIPELKARVEKAEGYSSKINPVLQTLSNALVFYQNPYAIDPIFFSILDPIEDREAGPYSKNPSAIIRSNVLITYQAYNSKYNCKWSSEAIDSQLGRPVPGILQKSKPTPAAAPASLMASYNPATKLDLTTLLQKILGGLTYALNDNEDQLLTYLENLEGGLCYGFDVVDPLSGFHRVFGLTTQAMGQCLVPYMQRLQKKQLDLTLCQPEPDALIPLIQAWTQLKIQLLILPRPLTVGEWEEFQKLPNLSLCMQALHVRVNPYFAGPQWATIVQRLVQSKKVGPQSAEPKALIDLAVTGMKIGPDRTLQCDYQEAAALPHRDDFPLPGYTSNLNRSDAYFNDSKKLNPDELYQLRLRFDIVKNETRLKLSRETPVLFTTAHFEAKMAAKGNSHTLGRVVDKPSTGTEEVVLEGK